MSEEPRPESPKEPIDDDAWRIDPADALAGSTPWRLSHLLYLIMACAFTLWLLVTFQGVVVPLIFILAIALVTGTGVILARGRASQQDSLLWMLAIAAEHQMPLATTVEAFADQYSGRYRRRVLRVAALLDGGVGLAEALARTPRIVSRDAVLLAHVGEKSGRLAEALRTAASIRAARAPIWTAISTRIAYILGVLLMMESIVGFVMYFIIPKFEAIFRDFGVPLPAITIFVIDVSRFVMVYLFWFSLVNFAVLGLVPFAIAGRLSSELSLFWQILIGLLLLVLAPVGLLVWFLFRSSLFDGLFRRQNTALILRSLALSIEGGRTIEGGLHTLARYYPVRWVQKRIDAAAREADEGGDWREALMRRGLLRRSDYDVLSSASAVGNLPWAMNELAESAERRFGIRVQVIIQTLFPLFICAIGVLVLTVAVACFAPLVQLIGRLSG